MKLRSGRILVSRKATPKVSKGVKKYVKKAVSRMSETRMIINSNPTAGGDLIDYGTPYTDRLTSIAQGDATYQRSGDKIQVVSLKGRVDVKNVNGTPYDAIVRVLIVRDKAPVRGTDTTLADVLPTYTNARMTGVAPVVALDGTSIEVPNSVRFETLYDKIKVCELKAGENAKDRSIFYINKKVGKPCQYLGNRDTDDDISKGQIYMFVFTDQSAEDGINMAYNVRVNFKDI